MAVLRVQGNASNSDEITRFQTGRYVNASEACWRIFDFSVHARHPTVIPLAVHLKNGQRVFFAKENAPLRLHSLFAIIATMGEVADPAGLWKQHCESMCDDILFQCQQEAHDMVLSYNDTIFNEGLLHQDDMLQTMAGHELSFYCLPTPTRTGKYSAT